LHFLIYLLATFPRNEPVDVLSERYHKMF